MKIGNIEVNSIVLVDKDENILAVVSDEQILCIGEYKIILSNYKLDFITSSKGKIVN